MKKVFILLVSISIFFSGCAKKNEYSGRIPAKPPLRIVSLAPSITEELFLLGEGEKLVGVTIYCQRPEEAKLKTKIGTMMEPDIEKIISLKPDLVFATEEGNRKEVVEKLGSAGVKVFTFGKDENLNSIWQNFMLIGKITGKEKLAESIIADLDKKILQIRELTEGEPLVSVFCEISSDPLITAAKGSFIDELISLAGGINIAHSQESRYPKYNIEDVVKKDPEVIIVVAMDSDMNKKMNNLLYKWSRFENMKAVAKARIFLVDPYVLCSPNPVALTEGLERIAILLHPEAFKNKK